MTKLILAIAIAFLVNGTTHAAPYKILPVKSYVLADSDGTPRYLVQYSDDSKVRNVYYTKAVKPSPRKNGKSYQRPAAKKRYWPTEVM